MTIISPTGLTTRFPATRLATRLSAIGFATLLLSAFLLYSSGNFQPAFALSTKEIREQGIKLYEHGDFASAADLFHQAAEDGDTTAHFFLGSMYLGDQGIAVDRGKAFGFLLLAAAGPRFVDGRPVGSDAERAVDDLRPLLSREERIEGEKMEREWRCIKCIRIR